MCEELSGGHTVQLVLVPTVLVGVFVPRGGVPDKEVLVDLLAAVLLHQTTPFFVCCDECDTRGKYICLSNSPPSSPPLAA